MEKKMVQTTKGDRSREENKKTGSHGFFHRTTIQSKLLLAFICGSIILLVVSLFVFLEINRSMENTQAVFENNVYLTTLAGDLADIHGDIQEYLSTKSTDSLEDYYRHEQMYQDMISELNREIKGNTTDILEKNIYNMSETYLQLSDGIISAKRGRNVELYKALYARETQLYGYIQVAIDSLNNKMFANNTITYKTMSGSLKYIEMMSIVTMVLVIFLTLMIMRVVIRSITNPLRKLAKSANEVAAGNFDIELEEIGQQDEVGIVTTAFIKMVHNIRDYIEQIKRSMENERQMKERELLMTTHLKDAQLKYLQAQINPHFLFNSLNAGAQLAMMEDAEKTSIFIEKMADFFRYNVKKTEENATLEMELETVDNYVYILNVRFSGDIHFEKIIDPFMERILPDVVIPSMILQPIVENAVNHGIRNVEWDGKISLHIKWEEKYVLIQIRDNGEGMTQERIEEVLSGKIKHGNSEGDSTGIGLDNCISRLELFYNEKNLLWIESEGRNMGTTVSVRIPYKSHAEVEENV